jgi:hypothetical protein
VDKWCCKNESKNEFLGLVIYIFLAVELQTLENGIVYTIPGLDR